MFNKFILLISTVALLSVISCQKESLTTVEATGNEVNSNELYFIDNSAVSANDFQWENETMHYHTDVGEKDNPSSEKIAHRAFTTEEGYDNHMRSLMGSKYDIHKTATEHLSEYAETSGAVAYLEENKEIPQAYLDYEKEYLQQHLPKGDLDLAEQKGLVAVLYKNLFCSQAFNITLPLLGTPFFIFNNNKASSFEGLLIGGYHRGFDKSFYRRAIWSRWDWGFTCLNLPPGVDNRISSWWSIGI